MPNPKQRKKKGASVEGTPAAEEYRVLVGLPVELYKQVKHAAVEKRTTFKKLVAEALQQHIEKEGGKKY